MSFDVGPLPPTKANIEELRLFILNGPDEDKAFADGARATAMFHGLCQRIDELERDNDRLSDLMNTAMRLLDIRERENERLRDALMSIDAIASRCIGEQVSTIEDELMRIGVKCRAGLADQAREKG